MNWTLTILVPALCFHLHRLASFDELSCLLRVIASLGCDICLDACEFIDEPVVRNLRKKIFKSKLRITWIQLTWASLKCWVPSVAICLFLAWWRLFSFISTSNSALSSASFVKWFIFWTMVSFKRSKKACFSATFFWISSTGIWISSFISSGVISGAISSSADDFGGCGFFWERGARFFKKSITF